MLSIQCATYEGFQAHPVHVEVTLTRGLPSFNIVGMVNTAISESKERVKSALLSNDYSFPPKRITVNLSPSDQRKEGSHFDLPIAMLILLENQSPDTNGWHAFGELGLDGRVKENQLLYPLMLSLANQNLLDRVIVPRASLEKLSNIPDVQFYGVDTLSEAIACMNDPQSVRSTSSTHIDHPNDLIGQTAYYYQTDYPLDFGEIRGQEVAKRAALISAAGMHNLLLEGSPGSGKSMIAKRLHYILPPVARSELLDIAKLETLKGTDPKFTPLRPFQSPHHSSTMASVFGGGSHKAQIGEVGLAHHGILFFDELPHFSRQVLEALREPLEDNKIRISRVNSKVEYPSSFLFVGAMNPCPCGNLLNPSLACRCSDVEVMRYKNRLSDPLLDRMDLYVQMQPVGPEDRSSVCSDELHRMVRKAHQHQIRRGQQQHNGKLDDREIEVYCVMKPDARLLLDQAVSRYSLSFRSINKIRKVARTIADINDSEQIGKSELLEALSYRQRR